MTEYIRYLSAFISIPGGWEWIVVLLIALIIFGKKLPDVARSLGKSLTAFKKGIHEVEETKDEIIKEADDAAKANNSNNDN